MRHIIITLLAAAVIMSLLPVQATQAADQLPAGVTVWQIDPVHSSIVWTIGHNNGAGLVYGRFNSFAGQVTKDAAQPERSTVQVTVEATSVDTAVTARDEHLRTPDFFNVAGFPQLSFTSTSVEFVDESLADFIVNGDLTMLGVSLPVSVAMHHNGVVNDRDGKPVTGFVGSFKIKRSDFGMAFGIPGIGDEVNIMLSFECHPQPTPEEAAAAGK